MQRASAFSNFYFNETLPGHFFLAPSIFLGRSVKRIISPPHPLKGKELVFEIVKRIFLSLLCILIALPCALLIPFGLLVKGISQSCRSNKVTQEEARPSLPPFQPLREIVSQPKKEPISSKYIEEEVYRDGNCLFACFVKGIEAEISVQALRNQTSDWILNCMKETRYNLHFETHLRSSLDNYLHVKETWLELEEEQLTEYPDQTESTHLAKRTEEIPTEKTIIQQQRTILSDAKVFSELEQLVTPFAEAMRSADSENLFHGTAIHLYALSQLYSVRIQIYCKGPEDYNLIESFSAQDCKKTLSFLLHDNHYNFLKPKQ